MKSKKIRAAFLNLCVLVGTLVVAYGVLTLGVHLFVDDGMQFNLEMWKYARDIKRISADPLIGHEHRPGTHSFLMGAEITINSQGLRDREIPLARTPGTDRIMMLGDSFILGWGVPFDDIIAKRMERRFAAEGKKVEVISAGVGNYNTTMEAEYYLTRGFKFHPDVLVLNYVVNDAEPIPSYKDNGFFARNSELLVVFMGAMDSFMRRFGPEKPWDQYYLGLFDTPGWAASKEAMHKLAEATRQQGTKLIIVSWPELHDVKSYRLQRITDLVHGVADAEHVPFIDLLPAVKDVESSKLWVTAPDPHPNAYANGLYAAYLYPMLQKYLPTQGGSQ
jgi:hypothetical protein